MINNKISEFTVNFGKNSMRISNNTVSEVYTQSQALQLLNKDHILIGEENNLFSIHANDMKALHAAIETHWCDAA